MNTPGDLQHSQIAARKARVAGSVAHFKLWFSRRKRPIQSVLAVVALGLACKVLVERKEELHCLEEFRLSQAAALCGLLAVYLLVRAYRFLVIARALGNVAIDFWGWFKVFVVGNFANELVGQVGNVYRATMLKRRYHLPYTAYVNAYVFFAWIDSLLNLALALLLILLLKPTLAIGGANAATTVGVMMATILAGPIAVERILRAIQPSEGVLTELHEKLHGMLTTMVQQGRDVGLMGKVVALGVVVFAIGVLVFWISFAGIGVRVGLAELALFLALYKLSTLIVITPGNLGVREIAYGLLGIGVGVSMAQGVLVSAIVRVAHYIILFPLSFLFGGGELLGKGRRTRITMDARR